MKIKNIILNDLKLLLIIFIMMFVFFKIYYFNENFFLILKLILSHFYLFLLPGYCLMFYYLKELKFYERFIIGMGLGYGIQPLIVYLIVYIFKVNMLNFNVFVSFFMLFSGLLIGYYKLRGKQNV
tara:strand:+ start:201 stop:575 length:375 start_codon:yes stop_codon:yes gene_type:complete